MFKKLLAGSMAVSALLALSACSDDNGSSANGLSGKNSCEVKKVGDNSVIMIMNVQNMMTNTSQATLSGGNVIIDMKTVYGPATPASVITEDCAHNKREAEELGNGSTVECTDNTVTIHSVEDGSNTSFERVYESAVKSCNKFYEEYPSDKPSAEEPDLEDEGDDLPENNNGEFIDPPTGDDRPSMGDDKPSVGDDKPSIGGNGDDNPTASPNNSRATCQILQDKETAFEMEMFIPDSGTATIYATYLNNVLSLSTSIEYLPTIPQATVDQFCAEIKEDIANDDYSTPTTVTCEGKKVTQVATEDFSELEDYFAPTENPIPVMTTPFREVCAQIQETGIIPDDAELDF